MKLIVIIITILVILLNIYIVLNKNNVTESFISSNQKVEVVNNPVLSSIYNDELNSSYEYDKVEDDVKRELLSTYDIYNSSKMLQHNNASIQYNLSEEYPLL